MPEITANGCISIQPKGLSVASAAYSLLPPLQKKSSSRQKSSLSLLLYQQTKPAVLLSQRLQLKTWVIHQMLNFFLQCECRKLHLCQIKFSNPWWFLLYHTLIHSPGIWQSLSSFYSCCTCKLCRIASTCYLCNTAYFSKAEYSPQLQTTSNDVWLWEALPKPIPPVSLVASQIPTLTWRQTTNSTHSTCPSQDLYRCKTKQNLAPGFFVS